MKRTPVLVLLALLCAAGGGLYWRFADRGDAPQDTLTVFGNVEIRQVELGFRVGGRIAELGPQEGQAVQPGEFLAALDPGPLQDALHRAEAELLMQEAELTKMRSGYRPEEVEQARAALDGYTAVLRNAEANLKRTEALWRQQAVAKKDLDAARSAYTEARSRHDGGAEQLRLMRSGYQAEDVERQQAAVQGARAAVNAARTQLDDTRLYALEQGVLLTRVREKGAVVNAGQTVCTLTLTHPVYVRAFISQPQLGFVRPGQPVLLRVDAAPNTWFPGAVGFISPQAEFTPKTVETSEVRNDLVFRFRVVAQDPDRLMRQGMPVTVLLRKDGTIPVTQGVPPTVTQGVPPSVTQGVPPSVTQGVPPSVVTNETESRP